LGKWQLEVGARQEFSRVSRDDADLESENNTFSASATLGWETEDIAGFDRFGIKLTASSTERAPSVIERFAEWGNEAIGVELFGGDLTGDSLDNEEATHVELSFNADWSWGNGVVTVYQTDFDNFIFIEEPNNGTEEADYVGRAAKIYGAEALVNFPLWDRSLTNESLVLEVSGDWLRGSDETLDQELPRSPTPRIGGALLYNAEVFDSFFELKHSFDSGNTPAEELSTDSYTLLNAGVTWKPEGIFTFSFRVNNILDEDIREHTSFRKDTAPLPGRGASFSMNWDY